MIKLLCGLLTLVLLACVASAADVTGKWKSEMTSPDGQTRTSTYDLKQDGDKLTGTVAGARGETPIQEGKVSGDTISFVVVRKFQDNEFRMKYTGKVSADEIKFSVEVGDRSFEVTAKKI